MSMLLLARWTNAPNSRASVCASVIHGTRRAFSNARAHARSYTRSHTLSAYAFLIKKSLCNVYNYLSLIPFVQPARASARDLLICIPCEIGLKSGAGRPGNNTLPFACCTLNWLGFGFFFRLFFLVRRLSFVQTTCSHSGIRHESARQREGERVFWWGRRGAVGTEQVVSFDPLSKRCRGRGHLHEPGRAYFNSYYMVISLCSA